MFTRGIWRVACDETAQTCRKCAVGVVERLMSVFFAKGRSSWSFFFVGSRKKMECEGKREKDRKPVVLLHTCDSGQICEAFVIMMQCEESSCGEKKKKKKKKKEKKKKKKKTC